MQCRASRVSCRRQVHVINAVADDVLHIQSGMKPSSWLPFCFFCFLKWYHDEIVSGQRARNDKSLRFVAIPAEGRCVLQPKHNVRFALTIPSYSDGIVRVKLVKVE